MGTIFASCDNTQDRHILVWARNASGVRQSISQDMSNPTLLPPGSYVLEWAFSGSGTITVALYQQITGNWHAFPSMALTMPGGISQMASWISPPNPYPPYNFTVV